MKYIIKDWAGNEMFNGETFTTFEDAYDFILCHIEDQDELHELHIKEL